jgi:L-asparaginase/Glu-tRNA(Gln) amidotransferase subunit D
MSQLPVIAVFSGPMATIQNSPDLVTSDKAMCARGLAHRSDPSGRPARFDPLYPQRLARPATVYVEQFSAHPLERDEADEYAPPDGYIGADGEFSTVPRQAGDQPVYRVELRPEDGLYPLPYMGLRADGTPWESPVEPTERRRSRRQTFYPDASRIYEEIDRFGVDEYGRSGLLSGLADFGFHRAAPPGGFRHAAETAEVDYFPYDHFAATADPSRAALARLTNRVQEVLDEPGYAGAQWLEGSPTIEETLYWLHLLIDTPLPIVGHSAQRRRQTIGADGDKNILDGVRYIASRVWAGADGMDRVGAVLVVDGLAHGAREVTKTAARPGGYSGSGAAGSVLAVVDDQGPPELLRIPTRRHTHRSQLSRPHLPDAVTGVTMSDGRFGTVPVAVKDPGGALLASAIPKVIIEKLGFFHDGETPPTVGILAWVERWLATEPLAGIVVEGKNPYGVVDRGTTTALRRGVFSGIPVVATGRGDTRARATRGDPVLIAGSDLTATKARILLMAALLHLGSLPPARDPSAPTDDEVVATREHVARYQAIFDEH